MTAPNPTYMDSTILNPDIRDQQVANSVEYVRVASFFFESS